MLENSKPRIGAIFTVVNLASSVFRPCCYALLSPHGVALSLGRQRSPRACQRSSLTGTVETQFGEAVADLLRLLDESGARGRRLKVFVSEYWSRPIVLPLPGRVPTEAETDILLQSQYRRRYGALMDGWHWCWDQHRNQLFAVAWPDKGLSVLREGVEGLGSVLSSAKPLALHVAANARIAGYTCWMAIIEQCVVSLIRLQDGEWVDWCVLPIDPKDASNLALQLARESARRDDECRVVTVVDVSCPMNIHLVRRNLIDAGWSVHISPSSSSGESMLGRLLRAISPSIPL